MNDWKITWDEYRELVYFCRQYGRKRAEAESLLTLRVSTPSPAVADDGSGVFLPHGGGTSDPVAAMAEKRMRLLRDCDMIDRCAAEAGGDLAPWLLRSVTRSGGARAVLADAPCSRSLLYEIRRKFFYLLKQEKEKI